MFGVLESKKVLRVACIPCMDHTTSAAITLSTATPHSTVLLFTGILRIAQRAPSPPRMMTTLSTATPHCPVPPFTGILHTAWHPRGEAEWWHGVGPHMVSDLPRAQGQVGVDARVREERERIDPHHGRDDRGPAR